MIRIYLFSVLHSSTECQKERSFVSQLPPGSYVRLATVSWNFVQTQIICMISFVYRTVCTSLLFQSTGRQLSLSLYKTAEEQAGFLSRVLDFTSEAFPSTVQDFKSAFEGPSNGKTYSWKAAGHKRQWWILSSVESYLHTLNFSLSQNQHIPQHCYRLLLQIKEPRSGVFG